MGFLERPQISARSLLHRLIAQVNLINAIVQKRLAAPSLVYYAPTLLVLVHISGCDFLCLKLGFIIYAPNWLRSTF